MKLFLPRGVAHQSGGGNVRSGGSYRDQWLHGRVGRNYIAAGGRPMAREKTSRDHLARRHWLDLLFAKRDLTEHGFRVSSGKEKHPGWERPQGFGAWGSA